MRKKKETETCCVYLLIFRSLLVTSSTQGGRIVKVGPDPPIFYLHQRWLVNSHATSGGGVWIHVPPLFLRFLKSSNTVSLVTIVSPINSTSLEGQYITLNHFVDKLLKL